MKLKNIKTGFLLGILICCVKTGYAQADKYEELTDTKPYNAETWKNQPETGLSWGSTDIRYSKMEAPVLQVKTTFSAKAWKGERINAQVLLWTKIDLSDISVKISDLTNGKFVIPSTAIQSNFVRYVMTDELNKDGKGACGHRPDKTAWDSAVVADVLDITDKIDVKNNTVQPIWINIWTPADANSGKYKGKLTVSGKNLAPMSLNIELEVLNRSLPAPKDWTFHLDLWQNPYSEARYHNVPLWSSEHFEAMRPVMKLLADAGQKVITATVMHKPWNAQTEDYFSSMVNKTKNINGSWTYDYTVFDRWVEFMQSLGIDKQINCYTMIPWELNFDYFDQATNNVVYVKAKPGSDLFNEYWGNFLVDFAKHLRQKNWFEKTTIAMDERPLKSMTEAIKLIKQIEPEFKISLAGHYHSEIEGDLHDLCIAFGRRFPDEIKAKREKAGKISTVYTCCSEVRPNTFTFSPPAEAAWLGWHVLAGNYDGYLRWAYNSWTLDPLRDSRFRTWAAGDCYLVYPSGRSSIRMERLIEGIQDFEKCKILKKEFLQKGETLKSNKLNQIISQFNLKELEKQGAAKMVENARNEVNTF